MPAEADLRAAVGCEGNHDAYRQLVELEVISTFAFQGSRWLADAAPHLLPADLSRRVADAKRLAQRRQSIEVEIPTHLLFVSGWPIGIPTDSDAELIASVRRRISELMALDAPYLTRTCVQDRTPN